MSWTTVCDIRMTSYQGNTAIDSSDFDNDASALGGASLNSGYVGFSGGDDQLEVPVRDDSLGRFAGLRVQALVRPDAIAHRYNIAEGWMSFALFIEADGRLMGTVNDGARWVGVGSGANRVSPGVWSRVSFEYDGVSIAKLTIDGATVGSRFDLSATLHQPQQVIALGHWPRGDDRYTLRGALGHVRIERRDFEDVWRDAMAVAFCRRRLTPAQADARRELEYLFTTLAPGERERLRNCAIEQSARMRALFNELRGESTRDVARQRALGDALRGSWCCAFNPVAAREALLDWFRAVGGEHGSPAHEQLMARIEEFLDIGSMCAWEGQPYDRMRELGQILFPELRTFEMDLREVAGTI